MPQSLVSRRPKLTKIESSAPSPRETKHEMATTTERPGNGRDRVRGSQIKDEHPHRYLLPKAGGWSSAPSSLKVFCDKLHTTTTPTKLATIFYERPRQSVCLDLAIQGR